MQTNGIFRPDRFLVPGPGVDLATWPVVACDQHSSEPSYWEGVEQVVGERPSTLRLVLPECWLGRGDTEDRIGSIHAAMTAYLRDGVLRELETGYVAVRRSTAAGIRRGFLGIVDLEAYDFRSGAATPVRPTEATIVERIPPRVAVRSGASLELSHTILLVDDLGRFDAAFAETETRAPLYRTTLLGGGGEVTGWRADGGLGALFRGLESSGGDFVYAVGDGNHSLAAAKTVWEETKNAGAVDSAHPARFAMVEVSALTDPGIRFEPIHRLVLGRVPRLLEDLSALPGASTQPASRPRILEAVTVPSESGNRIRYGIVTGEGDYLVELSAPAGVPAAPIQATIDDWLADGRADSIDYIHGVNALIRLASKRDAVGVLIPPMRKKDLFPWVREHGVLPRKAFSIGEAEEKRYYFEARRLR